MLSGHYTYRSYRNDPALVGGDAAAALALIFGEGVFDLHADADGSVRGALGMGTGYALTLEGRGDPGGFALVGLGLAGTATAGWRYDYRGVVAHAWPEAVDQIPCLVGTVIRVNAHGPGAPAGVTASFVAVRRPPGPPPTLRRNVLLAG